MERIIRCGSRQIFTYCCVDYTGSCVRKALWKTIRAGKPTAGIVTCPGASFREIRLFYATMGLRNNQNSTKADDFPPYNHRVVTHAHAARRGRNAATASQRINCETHTCCSNCHTLAALFSECNSGAHYIPSKTSFIPRNIISESTHGGLLT